MQEGKNWELNAIAIWGCNLKKYQSSRGIAKYHKKFFEKGWLLVFMIPIIQGLIISRIYNVKNILFTFFTIFSNSSKLGGISEQINDTTALILSKNGFR